MNSMKFNFQGKEYVIKFKHDLVHCLAKKRVPLGPNDDPKVWEGAQKITDVVHENRRTVCIIQSFGEVLTQGVSICDSRDKFSKEKGRVLALRNAIDNNFVTASSAELKQKVWEAYSSRKGT